MWLLFAFLFQYVLSLYHLFVYIRTYVRNLSTKILTKTYHSDYIALHLRLTTLAHACMFCDPFQVSYRCRWVHQTYLDIQALAPLHYHHLLYPAGCSCCVVLRRCCWWGYGRDEEVGRGRKGGTSSDNNRSLCCGLAPSFSISPAL